MSVVVDELEVVPAEPGQRAQQPAAAEPARSPEEVEAQVERLLALRHERAERLRAT